MSINSHLAKENSAKWKGCEQEVNSSLAAGETYHQDVETGRGGKREEKLEK